MDGVYPEMETISWPTCLPTVCQESSIPNSDTHKTDTTGNIPIGDSIDYTCSSAEMVMDSGDTFRDYPHNTAPFFEISDPLIHPSHFVKFW